MIVSVWNVRRHNHTVFRVDYYSTNYVFDEQTMKAFELARTGSNERTEQHRDAYDEVYYHLQNSFRKTSYDEAKIHFGSNVTKTFDLHMIVDKVFE